VIKVVGLQNGNWGVAKHDWTRGTALSHNGSNEILGTVGIWHQN